MYVFIIVINLKKNNYTLTIVSHFQKVLQET